MEIAALPGKVFAISNIPIRVPRLFMGRDDALVSIEVAFAHYPGIAVTALHGLRGVGKTTLAAAYAERHRGDYRATWWIRAQTEPSMRADFVALGVRLGWVGADDDEGPAVAGVMEHLCHERESILLIYDNAIDADKLKPYLPRGGRARVLVTSNAHAWRGVAVPVEIRQWPKECGGDYLIARTGRSGERPAAEALSEALGGLPLAHEQAAAYCERLDISLASYRKRFEAAPAPLLDDLRHAPAEYHDGLTVAKTFSLAIGEAAKLHPAAEPLIVHAALLAPEQIPLFLFSEARENFGEPLASALASDGLDEAVAALRTFALVDREAIVDDRDASITTVTIRLHRLVREVAGGRHEGETHDQFRRVLAAALKMIFPDDGANNPASWPRCALLIPHLLEICETEAADAGVTVVCADLLNNAGLYFLGRAAYSSARSLFERSLAIYEKVLGPENPETLSTLSRLARVLHDQGDLAGARPLMERALTKCEKVLGPEHRDTAYNLNALGSLLGDEGDLAGAQPLMERALAICEKVRGPEHSDTAWSLNTVGRLLQARGDLGGARPLMERALAIYLKVCGPEHHDTARSLHSLALLLYDQGDIAEARPLIERALAIYVKVLGPEHQNTATTLHSLARLLHDQGDLAEARPLLERVRAIYVKVIGPEHPHTAYCLNSLARVLHDQGDLAEARPLMERALAIYEAVTGREHHFTASGLNALASLLQDQGDLRGARPLAERALAIWEKVLGPEHPSTNRGRHNLARLILSGGNATEALTFSQAALSAHAETLGQSHRWTKDSAHVAADALAALGRVDEAAALRARHRVEDDGTKATWLTKHVWNPRLLSFDRLSLMMRREWAP